MSKKEKNYNICLGDFGEAQVVKILNALSPKNDAFVVSKNKDRYETIKNQLKNTDGKPDVIFTDANGNLKSIEVKTKTSDKFAIRKIEDVKETVMESQFEEFDMNEFMNDLDRVIDEIQNKNKLPF